MFKRIMLTLTFLAAFGTLGLGMTSSANAWRGWYGGPYRAYYGGPRVYAGYAPYRAYYAPSYGYAPYYAAPAYAYPYGYYGYPYAYPGSYVYGPRVAVSFGY